MGIMTNRNSCRENLTYVLVTLAILVAFQPGPAEAQDIEEIRKAAEQGEAKAQNNLGYMYDQGEGVPEDDSEAVKWYRKAAEQGHAWSQVQPGRHVRQGQGRAGGRPGGGEVVPQGRRARIR